MNPIYDPAQDEEEPVATRSRDALPFLLLGAATLSTALLWLKYRATEPALEARTRQRLARIRSGHA